MQLRLHRPMYVYHMNSVFAKTKCTRVDDRWISAIDQGHPTRNKFCVQPDDSHRENLIINLRLSEIFLICLESFSGISSDCCHCCRVQSRNGIFLCLTSAHRQLSGIGSKTYLASYAGTHSTVWSIGQNKHNGRHISYSPQPLLL